MPPSVNAGTICISFYLLTLGTSCANETVMLKTEHRGEEIAVAGLKKYKNITTPLSFSFTISEAHVTGLPVRKM